MSGCFVSYPLRLTTFIVKNVDIKMHLRNITIQMISFLHIDILHQIYHIEINFYKIRYTRYFIKPNSLAVMYHMLKNRLHRDLSRITFNHIHHGTAFTILLRYKNPVINDVSQFHFLSLFVFPKEKSF